MNILRLALFILFFISCTDTDKKKTVDTYNKKKTVNVDSLDIDDIFATIDLSLQRNEYSQVPDQLLSIINNTKQNNDVPNFLKAISYLFENSRHYQHFDEDLWVKRLSNEINQLNAVEKSVCSTFFAEYLTLGYGLNSKYREEIESLYLRSIENSENTSILDLKLFGQIIQIKEGEHNFTLFDYLAFRFYNHLLSNYEFHYPVNIADFIHLRVEPLEKKFKNTSDSIIINLVQTLKKQIEYHAKLNNIDNLIELNIKKTDLLLRLFPKAGFKRVLSNLSAIKKRFKGNLKSSEIDWYLARYYLESEKFKTALNISSKSLKTFKNNPRKDDFNVLKNRILNVDVSVTVPNGKSIKIKARNIKKVFLRIFKLTENDFFRIKNGYFENWEKYNSKTITELNINAGINFKNKTIQHKFKDHGQYLILVSRQKNLNDSTIIFSQAYQNTSVIKKQIGQRYYFFDFARAKFLKKKKVLGIYFNEFEQASYQVKREFTTDDYGSIIKFKEEENIDYLMMINGKNRYYFNRSGDMEDQNKRGYLNRTLVSSSDSSIFLNIKKDDIITIADNSDTVKVLKNKYHLSLNKYLSRFSNSSKIYVNNWSLYYSNDPKYRIIQKITDNDIHINYDFVNSHNIRTILWRIRDNKNKYLIKRKGSIDLLKKEKISIKNINTKIFKLDLILKSEQKKESMSFLLHKDEKDNLLDMESDVFERQRKILIKLNLAKEKKKEYFLKLHRLSSINNEKKYINVTKKPFRYINKRLKSIAIDNKSMVELELRNYREAYYLLSVYAGKKVIASKVFLLLNHNQRKHYLYHPGALYRDLRSNYYWYGAHKSEILLQAKSNASVYDYKNPFRTKKIPFQLKKSRINYYFYDQHSFKNKTLKKFFLHNLLPETSFKGERILAPIKDNDIIVVSNKMNPLKINIDRKKNYKEEMLNLNLQYPQFRLTQTISPLIEYKSEENLLIEENFFQVHSKKARIDNINKDYLYFSQYSLNNNEWHLADYYKTLFVNPFSIENAKQKLTEDSLEFDIEAKVHDDFQGEVKLVIKNYDDYLYQELLEIIDGKLKKELKIKIEDSVDINPVLQLNYKQYKEEFFFNIE